MPAVDLLTTDGLHKHYRMGSEDLHVLRGVTLKVKTGEWLAVLGGSGSGKSTLLHLLGGLDQPDEGTVRFRGHDVFELRGGAADRFRNENVGFVFQFYHLLPELNVLENTLISAMAGRGMLGWPAVRGKLRQRARALLDRLGLSPRLNHRPNQLSGGERQRVAIARAMINEPEILLADEPTGNLDRQNGKQILELFAQLHREGQTTVMVSHDLHVAEQADRVLTLENGRLIEK
ncbi:MAG: hypothetical protein CMJ49_09785 [Planctomycetaceae bacterium]|nr:hypothetical protein [Planctomycetaceae bacterium]